jgi:hypothetical protein
VVDDEPEIAGDGEPARGDLVSQELASFCIHRFVDRLVFPTQVVPLEAHVWRHVCGPRCDSLGHMLVIVVDDISQLRKILDCDNHTTRSYAPNVECPGSRHRPRSP